jgi:hypothetical protein
MFRHGYWAGKHLADAKRFYIGKLGIETLMVPKLLDRFNYKSKCENNG